MHCTNCGERLVDDAAFCQGCGVSTLPAGTCRACGAQSSPTSSFCPSCGAPLGARPAASAAASMPAPAPPPPVAPGPPAGQSPAGASQAGAGWSTSMKLQVASVAVAILGGVSFLLPWLSVASISISGESLVRRTGWSVSWHSWNPVGPAQIAVLAALILVVSVLVLVS